MGSPDSGAVQGNPRVHNKKSEEGMCLAAEINMFELAAVAPLLHHA
jgi:hypothetical protein